MELLSNFTCSKLNLPSKTALLGTVDGRMLSIELEFEKSYNRGPDKIVIKK